MVGPLAPAPTAVIVATPILLSSGLSPSGTSLLGGTVILVAGVLSAAKRCCTAMIRAALDCLPPLPLPLVAVALGALCTRGCLGGEAAALISKRSLGLGPL